MKFYLFPGKFIFDFVIKAKLPEKTFIKTFKNREK